MKWYRCLIRGENFPGEMLGQHQVVGFYTVQFVQDDSPQNAETKALAALKKHTSLQLPEGVNAPKSCRVYFEEIEEVSAEDVDIVQAGLSFHPMVD